ncbi:hypothetical protein [Legionella quateirensis]|uniref:Uncharacterized protein n=1 Tax=Legionella quateirensis TaxID=45072 RepID=A0A378KQI3_9GAMM|nr:hypothetical protein [Legionella quateirensis]KTD42369.1 hypothetical protein Lqua_3347 [Legionella quateirensis]STY17144.1 Uncharacterised protein [Legionella quateirensis]
MPDIDRDVFAQLEHFKLTSGFNLFNPDVTIDLTEQSKEIYGNAAPGAGFIFILELPDLNLGDDPLNLKLHLYPAFYKDDGLIHGIDHEGKKYPFITDMIIAPIGSLESGIQHDQVASILGLGTKRDHGLLLGGEAWKAGVAVRFLVNLPKREGLIPNDYVLTRDHVSQRWYLHFVNRVPLSINEGCVLAEVDTSTIQGLDEALNRLPDNEHITDYTFAERREITDILAQLPIPKNELLNQEEQSHGFKCYNNRSSTLNVLSIKYTDQYHAFFKSRTHGDSAHAHQLSCEIPLKIFEKIVNALSIGLHFPPESDLGSNPGVLIGPSAHFSIEQEWLKSTLKDINQPPPAEQFNAAPLADNQSGLEHIVSEDVHLDSSSTPEPYSELLSIVNSGFFIEPGIRFKEQFYPNLKALVKALEHHDELIDIQYIAVKGIEKNNEIKEQHPKRDHTQNDYRIILFESICNAESLEEAVDNIKSKFPQLSERLVDATKNTSS